MGFQDVPDGLLYRGSLFYGSKDDDALIYVPDTGEVLLGKNRYEKLMSCKDDPSTSGKNEGEIRVTYQKDHWVKGDLRPEHYLHVPVRMRIRK